MNAGDTLLIAEPGTTLDSHFWIVISDPTIDPDRVVIVNMTSYRADKDQACVLDRGDHPYISHRTCIDYKRAKKVSDHNLATLLKSNLASAKTPCSAQLLKKLRDGVAASRMPLELARILEEQGLIQL